MIDMMQQVYGKQVPQCPICGYAMSQIEDKDKFQCLGNNEIRTGHMVIVEILGR